MGADLCIWSVPGDGTVGLGEYLNTQVVKNIATFEALISDTFKVLKIHQFIHSQPSPAKLELPRTHNFPMDCFEKCFPNAADFFGFPYFDPKTL